MVTFTFQPASDDFDWSLTFFIRSILNRCILLHPPHMLPDVYIEAFKLSAAKLVDVSESDNPFDYIMSIFGYVNTRRRLAYAGSYFHSIKSSSQYLELIEQVCTLQVNFGFVPFSTENLIRS